MFERKNLQSEDSFALFHTNMSFTGREQYKLLRTNLSFTLPEDIKCPVIGVTSAMRGEGKSTTSVNLSYVLAQSGKKVLLIDGDLRIPSVAKKLNMASKPGLTDMLVKLDDSDNKVKIFKTQYNPNWYVMPAGELPPNPSELLASTKMERLLEGLKEQFDYIILDLPPVNLVSDAVAVSKYITGLVLVVRESFTSKKDVRSCVRQLNLSNVKVLGCVMNVAEDVSAKYSKYSKYGKYEKHGYGEYVSAAAQNAEKNGQE